jgi:RNA polymerase sigma factor (sigma-70 family)
MSPDDCGPCTHSNPQSKGTDMSMPCGGPPPFEKSLSLAQAGCGRDRDVFVHEHLDRVREHVARECRRFRIARNEVDDLVQECLVDLLYGPWRFDPERAAAATFIRYTILTVLDVRRRARGARYRGEVPTSLDISDDGSSVRAVEDRISLEQLLAQAKPLVQDALHLIHDQGFTQARAASKLGVSESKLSRALAAFIEQHRE